MKTSILALLASLTLTCSAHAAMVVTVPADIDQTTFDNQPHGLLGDTTIGGMTFSGAGLIEQGVGGNGTTGWAIPGNNNAMVLGANQTETVVFNHPQTDLLIAWYTGDIYNGVYLNNGVIITGGMLASYGFSINPGAPAANMLLDFSNFGSEYTRATFYSTSDSFEFVVNNDGPQAPVPEASAYVMLLVGFAGLGYAASKRTRLAARVA